MLMPAVMNCPSLLTHMFDYTGKRGVCQETGWIYIITVKVSVSKAGVGTGMGVTYRCDTFAINAQGRKIGDCPLFEPVFSPFGT